MLVQTTYDADLLNSILKPHEQGYDPIYAAKQLEDYKEQIVAVFDEFDEDWSYSHIVTGEGTPLPCVLDTVCNIFYLELEDVEVAYND